MDQLGKIGVLVMSYGTPESLDDVEAYYTHIRRGNAPSEEQLQELTSRYEAIVGGVFPLRENTNAQVANLQARLDELHPNNFKCFQGLKHAKPYIEDGVEMMAQQQIKQAVGIVLAPHYSVMSVGGYVKRAAAKAKELGIEMQFVESYHLHPQLIKALTDRVKQKFTELEPHKGQKPVKVLFSAHSLPEKIRALGDPYEQQLLDTSAAVAKAAEIEDWQFTWQSAGRTHEPWLGPDILDTMEEVAAEGYKAVLSAPIGFVSDHLEVLYDLDIEAKQKAQELNISFDRTAMLNSDPLYMDTLAESIIELAFASGKD